MTGSRSQTLLYSTDHVFEAPLPRVSILNIMEREDNPLKGEICKHETSKVLANGTTLGEGNGISITFF